MSIQQAMNSMLFSAQIGAGLYAHSSAGKNRAEVKKIKKEKSFLEKEQQQLYKQLDKEIDKHPQDPFFLTMKDRAEAGYAQKFEDIALRIHKQNPTTKSFKSLQKAVSNKTEKQQAFKDRIELLKASGREDLLKYFEKGGNE